MKLQLKKKLKAFAKKNGIKLGVFLLLFSVLLLPVEAFAHSVPDTEPSNHVDDYPYWVTWRHSSDYFTYTPDFVIDTPSSRMDVAPYYEYVSTFYKDDPYDLHYQFYRDDPNVNPNSSITSFEYLSSSEPTDVISIYYPTTYVSASSGDSLPLVTFLLPNADYGYFNDLTVSVQYNVILGEHAQVEIVDLGNVTSLSIQGHTPESAFLDYLYGRFGATLYVTTVEFTYRTTTSSINALRVTFPYAQEYVSSLPNENAAFDAGRQEGLKTGYSNGYDVGFKEGESTGYDDGYADGVASAGSGTDDGGLVGWLLSSLDALLSFRLLKYGAMEIQILDILSIALLAPLLRWFLKVFAGG